MENQDSPKPLPAFFVGKAITLNRIADYQGSKHPLLSQAIGKPETKSVWYSKNHIAKLLEEIDLAGGDGLRLHFGTYEQEHPFSGQLCILMTITREEIVGSTITHPIIYLEDLADFDLRSAATRDTSLDDDGMPGKGDREKDFNFGSPCPPLCD